MTNFEDKLVVLRFHSNYILDESCTTYNAVCNRVGSGLQMSWKKVNQIIKEFNNSGGDVHQLAAVSKTTRGTASEHYSFEHVIIKREMRLFCHEYYLKKLTDKGALSRYAELLRILEDEFDVSVSTEALRRRLIKDFDYAFFQILSVKNTFQTRRFLLLYSDALQSQIRGEIKVAYMDEPWVWRHHSTKKGIAPVGTTYRNIKSGKGERLIVVDAITEDGPLRCNGAE